jgi:hypothetical protein
VSNAPDNHWMLRANCRGKWDLFDSVEDENGKDTYPFIEKARALCSACPVWDECRAAGGAEVTNIWAGDIKGGKK